MKIILASNSPRRKELLAGLGIPFSTPKLPQIDESFPPQLVGEEIPLYIAKVKAAACKSLLSDDESLLITADTIVWIDHQALGKPHTEEEAKTMLAQLSGRTHEVITAVSISDKQKTKTFAVTTQVTFAALTSDEIAYYVSHYRPMDKAGAYGVQEWIGYIAVESITGSFYNVMGLPIHRLYREIKNWSTTKES